MNTGNTKKAVNAGYKTFKFYSDQWGAKVVFFAGDKDDFVSYMREKYHFNYQYGWDANCCGLSCKMLSAKDEHVTGYVIWMPKFDFTIDEYVSLAHECIHTAAKILDDRGVTYYDDAKEALTYTFDAIYRFFLNKLKGTVKK